MSKPYDGAKLFDVTPAVDGTFSNIPSTVLSMDSLKRAQAEMARLRDEGGIVSEYTPGPPMSEAQLRQAIADGWIIAREGGGYELDLDAVVAFLKRTAPDPEQWWMP